MKAILTAPNTGLRLRDVVLDAGLRRDLPRHRALRAVAAQQGDFRRRGENAAAGGLTVMTEHSEIDHVSGTSTTGHEWDGIKELNTPLPRWWLLTFYATIVWAIGYWVVYPAWPLLCELHHRAVAITRPAPTSRPSSPIWRRSAARRWRCSATAPLAEIEKDPALLALARARGKAAFGDNCAPCHGSGGAGAKGYPNLNDDDWLWGGTLDQIEQTIQFGARSGHAKAHEGAMLAFGKDGILKSRRRSSRWPTMCARCRACRPRRGMMPPPARRSSPRTARPATATTARAIRSSARRT